ncbi:hypothetical protein TspCOW1_20160 [Thiohalobacter sp. COW1]|uniref:cyclic-guanylate-specific phosphodiesterase n=1 Tax=Thiohalobacter thiocyanaticus TaxID=585455 RepID=A0A1Z4VN67_9GAMM|nr:diguanylate cyclase/phosphodiesterase [Thiohalobacter thiocyanaticus]BCO31913.1 hypothetical protein TspCOW1_20160 [Thiohalobacter sp. COW1]
MSVAEAVRGSRRVNNAGTVLVTGVLLVLFAAGNYLLPLSQAQVHWWANAFWTLGSLLTGLKCLAAARGGAGPMRRAWLFFALACLSWFAGMLVWDYQELLLGRYTPFPYWSDIGFLGFGVLMAIGLLFYNAASSRMPVGLLELSQLGIFVSSILIIHLAVFAEPIRRLSDQPVVLSVALAYPVIYMALFVYALAVLWGRMEGRVRRNMGYVIAAIATHATVNTLYAYSLLDAAYAAGHILDIFWLLGFGLLYIAAVDFGSNREGAVPPMSLRRQVTRQDRMVPVLALVLTFLALLLSYPELDARNFQQLLIMVLILLVFVALREWASNALVLRHIQEVETSEANLRRFFAISPAMVSITRAVDGAFYDVNEAFCVACGYAREELLGKSVAELGLWPDADRRDSIVNEVMAKDRVEGLDVRMRTRAGEDRELLVSIVRISLNDDAYLLSTAVDVTDRRRAEAEMSKLSSALEQTADMVMITDRSGVAEYVNPAFEQVTGYTRDTILGSTPRLLKSGKQGGSFYQALWGQILAGEVFNDVLVNKRNDGSLFYEQKSIAPLRDNDGRITHFISTGRDISERMQVEERLRFLAHHDTLTELPNRTLLLERLGRSLAAARAAGRLLCVLFLDLDRFKFVNDTLGHEAGDTLLRQLGGRLMRALRAHDSIARFGGDEFVIVAENIDNVGEARQLAERLLAVFRQPFMIDDNSLNVAASVGIGLFPYDGEDAGTLLRHADAAMYRAKERGGNTYEFYAEEIGAHAEKRLLLENELRRALNRDEFVLHYQPQVDSATGRPCGFEALIRWQHPERGLVPPGDFIPILEETGMIVEVGDWVLQTALRQLADWHRRGWDGLTMAVNLSSRQFERSGLPETLERALNEHGLDPGVLELEITEGTLMQDVASTTFTLQQLSRSGFGIALDDFGTGYSSLSYLSKFPFTTLKIDRAFVRDIPGDPDHTAITRAIVAMGQGLRLRLVAEGVETEEQRAFLNGLGCSLMQGYLYSRPLSAAAATAWLADSV